jgi:hypothetical protein
MGSSFLAAMRSSDGRSIARALLLLLLASAFLSGLHGGPFASRAVAATALCLAGDGPALPLDNRGHDGLCCLAGCCMGGVDGLPDLVASILAPAAGEAWTPDADAGRTATASLPANARGPPVLL